MLNTELKTERPTNKELKTAPAKTWQRKERETKEEIHGVVLDFRLSLTAKDSKMNIFLVLGLG